MEEDDDDFEWATEDVEEEEDTIEEPVDEVEVSDAVESEDTPAEDEIVESTTTTEAPPEPLAVNPARLLTPGKRYVSYICFCYFYSYVLCLISYYI